LASLALFGGLGVLGVDALSTWRDMVAWALAAMFLFTASAYFMRTRGDLVAMVPRAFPNPGLLVSVTGILKGLGAVGPVGLLIPATGGLAGLCSCSFWWRCCPPTSARLGGACPCAGSRRPRFG
jgi:hypothetical protein